MSRRALRRHHRARMIARAVLVQKKWWTGLTYEAEDLALAARRLANNLKCCSCCSPRYDRLDPRRTLQELRSDLQWQEDLDSLRSGLTDP